LGVPVFFAVSGFVIAYSAEGRTPIGFAIARFSRIYPTFVLCMTLTFAATLLFGAGHFEVMPAQWFANLFIAAPLLGQPYVDTSCTLLSVRRRSNGIDWSHGPIRREQPNPPVPRAPT
jgi:peptidoglycan/LPS O-acetylase OafA/YrhL